MDVLQCVSIKRDETEVVLLGDQFGQLEALRQLQMLKLKISIRSWLCHGLRPESQQPHLECHKASSRTPSEHFKDQRTDVPIGLRKACLQVCVKKIHQRLSLH